MNKKFFFPIAVLVLVSAAGATLYIFNGRKTSFAKGGRHTSTMLDPAFFDEAYRRAPAYAAADTLTRGGIVPHHLLAAPLIAGYFESLKPLRPTRVIIIGPDHLQRSRAPVIVTRGAWKTPYGILATDEPEIAKLVERGSAVEEQELFDVEHSISAIVPFVRRSLPRAKIVPILVNRRLSPDAAERLARALPLDNHTIILASVDFSHYLPSRVALFHDRMSRAVLSSFAFDELDQLEIDSPQSLRVLLLAMKRVDARHTTFVDNKTGAELSQSTETPETTSYLLTRFAVGDPQPEETTSTLIYPFSTRIKTAENRFFAGQDMIIEPHGIPSRTSPREGIEIVFGGSRLQDPVIDLQTDRIILRLPSYGRSAAVGVVSGPRGTDLYLFPMEFTRREVRFLLGREEDAALYSVRTVGDDDSSRLRTQVHEGIIHLLELFPPPTK